MEDQPTDQRTYKARCRVALFKLKMLIFQTNRLASCFINHYGYFRPLVIGLTFTAEECGDCSLGPGHFTHMIDEVLEELIQSLVRVDHRLESRSRLARSGRSSGRCCRAIRGQYAIVLLAHGPRHGHLKSLLFGVGQQPTLTTEIRLKRKVTI